MARCVKPLNPDGPAPDHRTVRVIFYLTPTDADLLTDFARRLGMPRGTLIGAIFERLMIGGFSVLAFVKVALQLQKRFSERGTAGDHGLYFGVRPLPALPESEGPDDAETLEALENTKKQLVC